MAGAVAVGVGSSAGMPAAGRSALREAGCSSADCPAARVSWPPPCPPAGSPVTLCRGGGPSASGTPVGESPRGAAGVADRGPGVLPGAAGPAVGPFWLFGSFGWLGPVGPGRGTAGVAGGRPAVVAGAPASRSAVVPEAGPEVVPEAVPEPLSGSTAGLGGGALEPTRATPARRPTPCCSLSSRVVAMLMPTTVDIAIAAPENRRVGSRRRPPNGPGRPCRPCLVR